MNIDSWINRSVVRLMPNALKQKEAVFPVENQCNAIEIIAIDTAAATGKPAMQATTGPRSTRARLQATLRHSGEALSPRMLRRTLQELQAVIDDRVSEVEGGRRAAALMAWYDGATPERRQDMWLLMSEMFVADPQKVQAAQAQFAAALGTLDEAAAEVHYRRATVSPRRRVLQRFSADATGIRFLVNLRAEMQPALKGDKPAHFNYGSAGGGTSHHLAGELFKQQSKTFITHIPYRGAGPALQDLIGGSVDMMFDGLGSSAAHIKGGRIKALMVSGAKRNAAFPDVPCATELGLPDYNVTTWYGLWAPKGTPTDVQARIVEEIRRLGALDEIKTAWAGNGADFPNLTPKQFGDFVSAEVKRWAAVVKAAGAKLD